MMNIEKIIIANKGMEIRITEMNNGQVVRDGIYGMTKYVNLIDNDYTIDYKTIAGLLCMTEEEFKRNYKLGRTESEREYRVCGADWILTYAEFTKKDEFDILLEAIQNGDIQIADDNDNSFNWDDEDYNDTDDDCFVSDGLAYDRAHGYILKELVRDNMGQIDHIDYVSLDDGSIVTIPKEDLYIDGVELLDYYGDCDYAFKSRLNSLIIMNQDGFEEQYEYFKAELDKFAKGLKQVGTKSNKHTDEIEQAVKSGAFAKVEEQANKVVEQLLDNKAKVEAEPVVVESKPVVTNNNMVIVKLQELMVKALEEGDFDAYDKLEERLNRLSK